jgi:hypothetical protein
MGTEKHARVRQSTWHSAAPGLLQVSAYSCTGLKLNAPGYYEITGLAWSGWGKVRKVDVSVDGGKSWKEAKLQDPILPMAPVSFFAYSTTVLPKVRLANRDTFVPAKPVWPPNPKKPSWY